MLVAHSFHGLDRATGPANARVFKHGFNDQSAELWSDHGNLLAISHQLVGFKS